MQNIFFIHNDIGRSQILRGSVMHRAVVQSMFFRTRYSKFINSHCVNSLPDFAKKDDIAIFVKHVHHDMSLSKRKGCITIYDPIDEYNPIFENSIDVYIANSKGQKKYIHQCYKVPLEKIIIIDHFHTNISRIKAKKRNINDHVVVGAVNPSKTAMLRKEVFNDLINFSTDNNFTIISNDITGISFPVNEIMGVENHYKYHENLHIGIALFDPKDLSYDRANLKPSNKVTSLASFDIPVVCSYQSALDPMIKKFPFFQEFIANDIEHAKKIILRLVRDYDYYQECKKMISEIGEMYHMDHSYDAYVTQINKMFGINIDNSLL